MNFGKLKTFFEENRMGAKGALCVGLVITREAIDRGLPIRFESLLTEGRGQVSSLGVTHVQKILADYGITRVLAKEGGRTNRGNMGLAERYLRFLNDGSFSLSDLREIESWWIERVNDFFSGKPLVMRFDSSKSVRAVVHDLIGLAEKRQEDGRGGMVVGTVLQHLVGAKLSLILPEGTVDRMYGASVADEVSEREGDFEFGDVVIHVTSAPTEALIRKCGCNLDNGHHPILITTSRRVPMAEGLAESEGIASRLDVWDIEQFISMNLNEHGMFENTGRKDMATRLVNAYNALIDACETDPSLRIEIGTRR